MQMIHIILGVIIVALGVWGISSNWWAFLDLFRVLLPFLAVCLGITMIMAGVRGKPRPKKEEEEE